MSYLRYTALRTVQTIVLIFLVVTFLFFLFRLMPGDFSDLMMHGGASEEAVKAFEERWGLDQPLHIQYRDYMINFFQGNFGYSLQYQTPVWEYVNVRMFNTFILAAPAATTAYIVGVIIGTILGVYRGSKYEKHGLIPFLILSSFPGFFTAILLIVFFANYLGLVPSGGIMSSGAIGRYDVWWRSYLTVDFLHHYILPFTVVVLRFAYLPILIMRTSVVEVMGQDFIKYNKITGLSSFNRGKHIAHHAILPVITLYPISLTRAISGLVIIEIVFNWPGIGYALIQAVLARDFPIVMFIFAMTAIFVIIANFVIDIVYSVVDPRIQVGSDR